MSSILICWIITGCIVMIWGYFDAPNQMASQLMERLTKGKIKRVILKKPWGCSTCQCFYITLLVLLIMSPQLCWMSVVYAFSSKFILYFIQILDKLLTAVFIRLEKICNKI